VGTVHAVEEDTGRKSDDDRTDNFGLGACGSWWCGEEAIEGMNGEFSFCGFKNGPLSVCPRA
jgi:hypothetical protein